MSRGGKRPGAGRPASPASKTVRILVRFTAEEALDIGHAAKPANVSTWIRAVALRAARTR